MVRALSLWLACLLTACAPLPQRAGIPTRWQPSPNFDQRRPEFRGDSLHGRRLGGRSAAHSDQPAIAGQPRIT